MMKLKRFIVKNGHIKMRVGENFTKKYVDLGIDTDPVLMLDWLNNEIPGWLIVGKRSLPYEDPETGSVIQNQRQLFLSFKEPEHAVFFQLVFAGEFQ